MISYVRPEDCAYTTGDIERIGTPARMGARQVRENRPAHHASAEKFVTMKSYIVRPCPNRECDKTSHRITCQEASVLAVK